MGNDLAVREHAPAMVRLSSEQLQYIAHTEFVPKSMRGKLPAILACVAMGRELGLGDMVALRNIHVIDGRVALSAEVMVALVRDRGHSIVGNFSGDSCTVTGKRIDNDDEITVTWTKEMAKEAGLLNKDNYKKYTPAMLWARSVSQLCRMLFADCFAGATHTQEEIAEGDYEDFTEIEDSAVEPQAEETPARLSGPSESTVSDAPDAPGEQPSSADVPAPSAAQIKKLNVLVGTLREAGKVTTEDVWRAVGREYVLAEAGELHWSPLRDSLTKAEAHTLIEWLTAIEAGQPAESQTDGLTVAQLVGKFKELVGDDEDGEKERALADAMTAKIKDRFPGRSRASELSDAERADLWADVSAGLAAGVTVDG